MVGADCLYAPLPATLEDLERICRSTAKPVNALAAGPFWTGVPLEAFARIGVARVSLGSALARVTHRALIDAARSVLEGGDHAPLGAGAGAAEVDALLAAGARDRR